MFLKKPNETFVRITLYSSSFILLVSFFIFSSSALYSNSDVLNDSCPCGHQLSTDIRMEEQERRVHPRVLIPEDVTQIILFRVAMRQTAWTEGNI